MKATLPPPGYRDRGMRVRIYPTADQECQLLDEQPSCRACWNWLCTRNRDVIRAYTAKAIKEGIVGPATPSPDYNGMDPDAAKAAKLEHKRLCSERQRVIMETIPKSAWRPPLTAKPGVESEASRLGLQHDYQVLNWYLRACGLPTLPAHVLQALAKNFYQKAEGQRAKKPRKRHEVMPIQVRSGGQKLFLGPPPKVSETWGCRRSNPAFYNGYVSWEKMKLRARLDPRALQRLFAVGSFVREGVTICMEADGWYASVKVVERIPKVPCPNDGSVLGIDPGHVKLAAFSDPALEPIDNLRNLGHADRIAGMQQRASSLPEGEARSNLENRISREHQRARRRTRHELYNLAKHLAPKYHYVGVEQNNGIALGIGSRFTSSTKVMLEILQDKLGADRVREVDAFKNSQRCSQCGKESKTTWKRRLGQKDQACTCPACGYTADRDHNAARNVAAKLLDLLRDLAA